MFASLQALISASLKPRSLAGHRQLGFAIQQSSARTAIVLAQSLFAPSALYCPSQITLI
jgi:hypothetical protein